MKSARRQFKTIGWNRLGSLFVTTTAISLMTALMGSAICLSQQPKWRLANGTAGWPTGCIAVYPSDPDTVYAGGWSLLMSTDGGARFDSVSPLDLQGPMRVDPVDSRFLYAEGPSPLLSTNDLIRSTDGGQHWSVAIHDAVVFFSNMAIEIDPRNHRTVYVAASPWFFRSTDQGQTWDTMPHPPAYGLSAFALAPSNDSILFAGYGASMFKSTNAGGSWDEINPEIGHGYIEGIVIHPADPMILYATISSSVDSGGVMKSTDGGATWMPVNSGLTSKDRNIFAIAINTSNPEELFIAPFSGSRMIFRSKNGGNTWESISGGLPSSSVVSSIAIDTTHRRVYAAVNSSLDSTGVYVLDEFITSAPAGRDPIPKTYALSQNYPNPFNPTTLISFNVPTLIHVRIQIWNVLGECIGTLIDEEEHAGNHNVTWNAGHQPSGLYFYRMTAGEFVQAKKAIFFR